MWKYVWLQPCRALRIWDGFQIPTNSDDVNFLSEMQDVHAHTGVEPWEHLMRQLRHYAAASHVNPVVPVPCSRTQVPDGAGFD